MLTILLMELFALVGLVKIALPKGLEAALPFATFMIVLAPTNAFLPVGIFGLTTQRLIVITLTLFYFLSGGNKTDTAARTSTPLKVLIVIHVGWCLISTADSIVPAASIKQLFSMVFDYYLLYLIYLKTVTKVETIHKILMGLVLGVVAASVFGAIEAYRGWSVMSLFPLGYLASTGGLMMGGERGLRIHSTYPHAILYGAGLVTAILLALYLPSVMRKQRFLLWGGLLLMFLNLFKTMSRGPWLGAILGCLLLFLFARGGIHKRVVVIGILAVATCIIRPGVWETLKNIYVATFDPTTVTGGSFEYRFKMQDAAVKRLLENPRRAVWGYGLESFYEVHLEGNEGYSTGEFNSGDNAWVALMVHTGFVGLLIFFLLLMKPAWVAWKQFRTFPAPDKYLALVLFVNLVVFYFEMYSVWLYGWGQNGYMLWTMIALIFAYPRCRELDAAREHFQEADFPKADPETRFQTPWSEDDHPKVHA